MCGQVLLELLRRAGEERHDVRAVVNRDDVLDAEKPGGVGGLERAHRQPVADGQEGEVRIVELPDQPHVAEERGVAGMVELEAALELDHVTHRLAAVDEAPVVDRMLEEWKALVAVTLMPPTWAVPPFWIGCAFSTPWPWR